MLAITRGYSPKQYIVAPLLNEMWHQPVGSIAFSCSSCAVMPLWRTEWSILLHTQQHRQPMFFNGPENSQNCPFQWGRRRQRGPQHHCLVKSYPGQLVPILVNSYPKGRSTPTLACKSTRTQPSIWQWYCICSRQQKISGDIFSYVFINSLHTALFFWTTNIYNFHYGLFFYKVSYMMQITSDYSIVYNA